MSKTKPRTVFILGPIGLSMDDGASRSHYIKMRAMAYRELKKMAKEGPVVVLTAGTPWSGHIGVDLAKKLKKEGVRLEFEMSARFDEVHTRDRKLWDGRFDGSKDGSRLNAAHMGFSKVIGAPSLKALYSAREYRKCQTHQSMVAAHRIIIKRATTIIAFPTIDFAMKEILDEFKSRDKEIISFSMMELMQESIVPKTDRLSTLKKALILLQEKEWLLDKVRGDIFVEALEIIKLHAGITAGKAAMPQSSACRTSPPHID